MNKLLATGMALSVFVGSAAAGSVSASAEMESKELAIQTSQAKEDVVKPEATPAACGNGSIDWGGRSRWSRGWKRCI